MSIYDPWWLLPTVLFIVPLIIGLIYNARFKHKFGISQHLVLALFVLCCWVSAIVIILRAVR